MRKTAILCSAAILASWSAAAQDARSSSAAVSNAVAAEAAIARAAEAKAIQSSSLGQPGGPALLGSSGTVPLGQIPVGTGSAQVAPGNLLTALPACTAGSTVAPVPTGQPFQCGGIILIAQ